MSLWTFISTWKNGEYGSNLRNESSAIMWKSQEERGEDRVKFFLTNWKRQERNNLELAIENYLTNEQISLWIMIAQFFFTVLSVC